MKQIFQENPKSAVTREVRVASNSRGLHVDSMLSNGFRGGTRKVSDPLVPEGLWRLKQSNSPVTTNQILGNMRMVKAFLEKTMKCLQNFTNSTNLRKQRKKVALLVFKILQCHFYEIWLQEIVYDAILKCNHSIFHITHVSFLFYLGVSFYLRNSYIDFKNS